MPPTLEAPGAPEKGLDFHQYWTVIRKRWWLILATAAVVCVFMGAITLRRPKIYMATATVVIDPQAPRVLDPNQPEVLALGTGNYWSNTEYYNTQYKIIRSKSLALEVVRKYEHLMRDPRLVGPIGNRSDEDLLEAAALGVQGSIRVMPVKDSRVVGIGVRHQDPKLAAELANAIANVYIEQNLALKLDTTRSAKRWIAKELDEAKGELETAEQALYDFRKVNNILSMDLEDQVNMVTKSLRDFNGWLTETQKQRYELEERRKAVAELIEDKAGDGPSAFGPQGASLEPLRRAYVEEKRKLDAIEQRYGPKHHEYINQASRVEMARNDMAGEARIVLKVMDEEIGALARTEKKHAASVDKLTQDALNLNQREIEYKTLARRADNAQTVYAGLIKRLNESGLQEQDQGNNIRLLDRAEVAHRAVEPNIKNAIMLTVVLMLLLALGLAFFVEFLDRSVKTQEDLEAAVGAPFLGFVPTVAAEGKAGKELFVLNHPKSTAAECCRVVRTNILFCSPDKPLRTILVTSSNPVEGKTMNVVNLGITMAQGGHKTILVDTDMRRPRLHKVLGLGNEHGVSRLTVEEGPLEDAVKTTDVPNLYLLPCGPIPPNPAELIQTEKFNALVKRLLEKYDRVIFDSPPVLAVTDAAVLSRVVDGTVLVVRAGSTSRDAVIRARQRLTSVNARMVGAVLNDVNLRNPHYASYYYQYQYKYHETPSKSGSSKATPKPATAESSDD
jgi:polysaccharide biosynthesis transport protein